MQAARGTSLNSGDDDTTGTIGDTTAAGGLADLSPSRRWALRAVFAGVALLGYAADQTTKALAVAHLTPGAPKHVVGEALRFDLIRNSGAAFSTGTSHTEWFTALAIAALVFVIWLGSRLGSVLWSVALGLLAAGVAGNLTDRIARAPQGFRGHVVDFLEFPHWPVFNMADVCINIAAVLIVIQVYRGVRLGGGRRTEQQA